MHKNPHQNAGNGIKETLFFKIFLGTMPPAAPRGSRAFGASLANSCPPPLYTRKNLTTCSKSANKPSTSCVRMACHNLSTSLEQAVNNL